MNRGKDRAWAIARRDRCADNRRCSRITTREQVPSAPGSNGDARRGEHAGRRSDYSRGLRCRRRFTISTHDDRCRVRETNEAAMTSRNWNSRQPLFVATQRQSWSNDAAPRPPFFSALTTRVFSSVPLPSLRGKEHWTRGTHTHRLGRQQDGRQHSRTIGGYIHLAPNQGRASSTYCTTRRRNRRLLPRVSIVS